MVVFCCFDAGPLWGVPKIFPCDTCFGFVLLFRCVRRTLKMLCCFREGLCRLFLCPVLIGSRHTSCKRGSLHVMTLHRHPMPPDGTVGSRFLHLHLMSLRSPHEPQTSSRRIVRCHPERLPELCFQLQHPHAPLCGCLLAPHGSTIPRSLAGPMSGLILQIHVPPL